MNTTYPAEEVDPLLADLQTNVNQALKFASEQLARADALEAEARQLRAKVAGSSPTVKLEKIAFDKSRVNEVLDDLIGLQLLQPEHKAKVAAELIKSPEIALDLIQKVAKVTVSPVMDEPGSGVSKSGSKRAEREDATFSKLEVSTWVEE